MTSTGINNGIPESDIRHKNEKAFVDTTETPPSKREGVEHLAYEPGESDSHLKNSYNSTHRKLKPRHIQLIGIGGTIGTALYVQIDRGSTQGGPGSLFIAFTLWLSSSSDEIGCVRRQSMAERVTYLPISLPFIRFAGWYVDEALGVAAGYDFFAFEAALVSFEVVACNVNIHYWSDPVLASGIIVIVLILYGIINRFAVKCRSLRFSFLEDTRFFAEYYRTGTTGQFVGFLQCLVQASFIIAGPDYVSMAAGEAENPRLVMPRAYKAVFYRLTAFFVLGSLWVGIVVAHDDPELNAAFTDGLPGAAASPYVVSMNRLKITVMPDLVNAMALTAAFSADNNYATAQVDHCSDLLSKAKLQRS
ncbi:MAG: hypothetical protein M1835_003045 [Candelina submexicana]|nr:MAG: hypothetical protein M1835_003045 [Candelina submexicana]